MKQPLPVKKDVTKAKPVVGYVVKDLKGRLVGETFSAIKSNCLYLYNHWETPKMLLHLGYRVVKVEIREVG